MEYNIIPSLGDAVGVPEGGVLSKPVHTDARMRVTLFAMAAGQELSEHTTTMEAVLHFLEGEASVTVGGERIAARAGTWIQMNPSVPHSIAAVTPLKMLLIVLREPAA